MKRRSLIKLTRRSCKQPCIKDAFEELPRRRLNEQAEPVQQQGRRRIELGDRIGHCLQHALRRGRCHRPAQREMEPEALQHIGVGSQAMPCFSDQEIDA